MLECIDRYNQGGSQLDLDEAIVHGRDAALARARRRLSLAGVGVAANHAEDLAQDVALGHATGIKKVADYLRNFPDARLRRRKLATANSFLVATAIRNSLRGPRLVHMEQDGDFESIISTTPSVWSVTTSAPDEVVGKLERLGAAIDASERIWKNSKAGRKAGGWSPFPEITGHANKSDRPCVKVLPKRSCQRAVEQAKKAVARRLRDSQEHPGPSL